MVTAYAVENTLADDVKHLQKMRDFVPKSDLLEKLRKEPSGRYWYNTLVFRNPKHKYIERSYLWFKDSLFPTKRDYARQTYDLNLIQSYL